jgi:WD40 repeat protein
VASGELIATLAGHTSAVLTVAFSPDGSILASGGASETVNYDTPDRTVRLWDIASGEALAILTGHSDGVRSVAFSPHGTSVASGSFDATVRLWTIGRDTLGPADPTPGPGPARPGAGYQGPTCSLL